MSASNAFGGGTGKKAVHVKWAGKTIALGTFPATEADEKCARAKALTRAWRSTMRPKPTRDWVMTELERLGVRVVSGRLGRKAGEDADDKGHAQMGGPPPVERSGSIGWGADGDLNSLMAGGRRPSMNLAMMGDGRRSSIGSLGPMVGLDGDAGLGLGHRGLGGGFDVGDAQRRASSLGLGSLAPGGLGNIGMSVNPNQHYEMLKLHHMNLLNEIQETTLMMNLYQQQQLQQQQQQLQQQASAEGMNDPSQMGMMQQNGIGGDGMYGANLSQQQRASLGLGSGSFSSTQQMQMMSNQQQGMMGSGPAQPQQENQSPAVKVEQATGAPASESTKRSAEDTPEDTKSKRQKTEGDAPVAAEPTKTEAPPAESLPETSDDKKTEEAKPKIKEDSV